MERTMSEVEAMLAFMTEVELGIHRRDDAMLVMPMCHANSLNFFSAFAYVGGTVTIFCPVSSSIFSDMVASSGFSRPKRNG